MTDVIELNEALAGAFMQVQVTVRKWNGKALDRSLSDELESTKAARHGSLKTIKNLMAGADGELRAVNSALDAVRTMTYNRTLPWSTSSGALRGPRLLPIKASMDFLSTYKQYVNTYQLAKQEFLMVYDQRRQQAITNLGAAANPADYPTMQEIDDQFAVDLDISPVAAINDFSRLPIPADVAEKLGHRMAEKQEKAIHNAMNDLFGRVLESVQRMATQLGKHADEGNARLYKTMVQSTRDTVGLLRSANITNDSKLTELADRIERDLCPHDVEVYKENLTLSKTVAQQATLIAKEVEDIVEWY